MNANGMEEWNGALQLMKSIGEMKTMNENELFEWSATAAQANSSSFHEFNQRQIKFIFSFIQ